MYIAAESYANSEDVLGKWYVLSFPVFGPYRAHRSLCRFERTGKRSEIFLATKFGVDGQGGDPQNVHAAIEKSLKRLGVKYVDLYYSHRYVLFTIRYYSVDNLTLGYSGQIPEFLSRSLLVLWLS